MSTIETLRHADLATLRDVLLAQRARAFDVTAGAQSILARDAGLVLRDVAPSLLDDGVLDPNGTYDLTQVAMGGIADKLGIPAGYLKRLAEDRHDLFDANVNGWLHGRDARIEDGQAVGAIPADARSFFIRCLRGQGGGPGVARAFLSDRYGVIDNLEVLLAAMEGIAQSGHEVEVQACDLTERRMYVRINAPTILRDAPTLMQNYRSPFDGRSGREYPAVSAGIVLSNSEVGAGAFTITPRITFLVCTNGQTIDVDAVRSVHLGGQMEHGVVTWSEATVQKALALVTAKTRDAVTSFLSEGYLDKALTRLEQKAGAPLTDAVSAVNRVAKAVGLTKPVTSSVLDMFIRGGDTTPIGIFHAVTAAARATADADDAFALEAVAGRALNVAAALA